MAAVLSAEKSNFRGTRKIDILSPICDELHAFINFFVRV
jgi:hypothetical protein